ncbi:META domain-containing protein [Gordonia alkaliphila]|uniref:META domain-containing protein n=1 Tax=Gordonia alkaliphila TaxID=1053547 RepID=A0ABP8Z992_9ACTN
MSSYRRILRLNAVLALVAVAALSGCGSDEAAAQSEPSALVGKTYLSTEVTGPAIPGGGPMELTFPQPGRIAATAGCNRHMGEVTFDGSTMTPGQLASTMMACPGPAEQADAWLADFLSGPLTWSLADDTTLTLSRGEGDARRAVTLVERANTALTGTTWTVTAIVTEQAVESSRAIEDSAPNLRLADDGTVSGSTGCNNFRGNATVTGDKITFSGIAATKMACPPEIARVEQVVLDTLRGSVTYRIDGNELALTNDADPNAGLRLRAN